MGDVHERDGELLAEIKVWNDNAAEKLDKIANLCEIWKRSRDKGLKPSYLIRRAIIRAALELPELMKLVPGVKVSVDT